MTDHDPHGWIAREIQAVASNWDSEYGSGYWQEPLVAVASAADTLFGRLKQVVNPEHALPRDLLPEARSVVVFFLPFVEGLSADNDAALPHAARSWALAYVATNRLITDISTHLSTRIEEAGYRAATTPATHNFDERKLISRWSHKHLAYIAGLGTFGHHHLLITAAGCCGRLGSLVTNMPLPPTPRPSTEGCLEKAGRRCMACVVKCRYNALSETRFNRHRCYAQCLSNDAHHSDLPLVDVCGKCACGVPCSHTRPTEP